MSERSTQFLRSIRRWQPLLILVGGVIWTLGTGLVAGWWTYHTYNAARIEHQIDSQQAQNNLDRTRAETEQIAAETRKLEVQRPFLQKKLDIFFEAVQVAGKLTDPAIATDSAEWKANTKRFWELRWSELEMVGDPAIRDAARRILEQITEVNHDPLRKRHDLRWMVECLSDEARLSLEHSWGYQPSELRRTATGQSVSKLPKGCTSGADKPMKFEGMLEFKDPLNQGPRTTINIDGHD
jgi:hypothetical protein